MSGPKSLGPRPPQLIQPSLSSTSTSTSTSASASTSSSSNAAETKAPPTFERPPTSQSQARQQPPVQLAPGRWEALPLLDGTLDANRWHFRGLGIPFAGSAEAFQPSPHFAHLGTSPARNASPEVRVQYVESLNDPIAKLAEGHQAILTQVGEYRVNLSNYNGGALARAPDCMFHGSGSDAYRKNYDDLQNKLIEINTSIKTKSTSRLNKLPASVAGTLSGTKSLEKQQQQVLDDMRTLHLARSDEVAWDSQLQLRELGHLLKVLPDISRAEAQTEIALKADAELVAGGFQGEIAWNHLPENTINYSYSASSQPGTTVVNLPVQLDPQAELTHAHRHLAHTGVLITLPYTHRGTGPHKHTFQFPGNCGTWFNVTVNFNSPHPNVKAPVVQHLPGGTADPDNAPPDYSAHPSAPEIKGAVYEPQGGATAADNKAPVYEVVQPSAPEIPKAKWTDREGGIRQQKHRDAPERGNETMASPGVGMASLGPEPADPFPNDAPAVFHVPPSPTGETK